MPIVVTSQNVSALELNSTDFKDFNHWQITKLYKIGCLYLPVLLRSLEETQAFVRFRPHLVHVGHGVDGPGIIRNQSEALHKSAT